MPNQRECFLAIETSSELCSVAVGANGKVYSKQDLTPRAHAQLLLPTVDSLLLEAGETSQAISKIAVGVGPGSFTGIRIGMGVAQGLAYGFQIPLIGVPSLLSLAQGLPASQDEDNSSLLVCCLDARMQEVYWAAYRRDENNRLQQVCAPAVSEPSVFNRKMGELKGRLVGAGHGFSLDTIDSSPFTRILADALPNAHDVLSLASSGHRECTTVGPRDLHSLEPLYLRNEVAWKKRARIRTTQPQ